MTTSNLIPVFSGSIQNQPVQLCNAVKLHAFLDIQSKFADWIKNRIEDYGFVQDEDYIIVTERTAGRPRKEYHITLDMGKELAMVERNEKGRQIRKYFIACEKALQNKSETQPLERTINIEILEKNAVRLASLWFALYKCRETLSAVAEPLTALGSRLGTTAYTQATEYYNVLDTTKQILEPILDGVQSDDDHYRLALDTLRNHQIKRIFRLATR